MKLACRYTLYIVLLLASPVLGDETSLNDITNYREYSPLLSSSGQPNVEQLEAVRDAGFERVVFLAYTDSEGSIEGEDSLVEKLGMQFVHIPVDWGAPRVDDFEQFAAVVQAAPAMRTLVHCQVNFRASTFAFLYRVLYEDVPISAAKDDLDSVWVPDETWKQLIFDVLEMRGVSPDCDSCLWE